MVFRHLRTDPMFALCTVTAIFASPQSPSTPATVIGPLNTSLSSVLISLNVVDDVLLIDGNAVAGTAIGTL